MEVTIHNALPCIIFSCNRLSEGKYCCNIKGKVAKKVNVAGHFALERIEKQVIAEEVDITFFTSEPMQIKIGTMSDEVPTEQPIRT